MKEVERMDYKVLIVEDEPRLRAVLCDWFRFSSVSTRPITV